MIYVSRLMMSTLEALPFCDREASKEPVGIIDLRLFPLQPLLNQLQVEIFRGQ